MSSQNRKELVRSFLGKTVHIKIDRPVGFIHQKNDWSITYPLNYGFIPDVFSADGEELDVYLLGITAPVTEYTAEIIGIVHRKNDCEDKLLAAPQGMDFTKEEAMQVVHFQEQFFETEIEMFTPSHPVIRQYSQNATIPPAKVRISARAIVTDGEKLLLSYEGKTDVYMSPGGGLEENETLEECCAREVLEETGLVVKPVRQLCTINEYCPEALYISPYFLCEIVGTGERHLTEIEIDRQLHPVWLSFEDALSVFGTYESKRPDHRSLYQREYTVLTKVLNK